MCRILAVGLTDENLHDEFHSFSSSSQQPTKGAVAELNTNVMDSFTHSLYVHWFTLGGGEGVIHDLARSDHAGVVHFTPVQVSPAGQNSWGHGSVANQKGASYHMVLKDMQL